jgi:hypothetical protein
MLIDKGVSKGDVVSLKLVNGDEIIAKLEEETDTSVKLNRPLTVVAGPNGLGMIPWMFLSGKETFTLARSHIFVMTSSKKEAADQYTQGTTGLAIRSK